MSKASYMHSVAVNHPTGFPLEIEVPSLQEFLP